MDNIMDLKVELQVMETSATGRGNTKVVSAITSGLPYVYGRKLAVGKM